MNNRRGDKIREIETYVEELESAVPPNFNIYHGDFKIRAVCERYFEKIMEAVVDLAFLVIKEKDFRIPEDDKQAFDILKNENLISIELAEKLKDAKGMRNVIAHEYGKIDDELVFEAVAEQLIPDVSEFIELMEKLK